VKIKRGSTSVRRLIFIGDTSKTDGSGLANLVHNSSGLVAYYFAGDLSADVQITLATATLGTWTSGGFVAVDNTGMPGWYEIGIPNAALDGGNEVAIQLRGATNMAPVNIYISLDAVDYQDASAFGLSRVDATISSRMASFTFPTGFLAATFPTTVSSYAGGAVASVTGSVGGISGVSFPANFGLLGINGSGHLVRVVLVDTTTSNTDMRGTDGAALAVNYTAGRAQYLDNLNVGGPVASQADINSLNQSASRRVTLATVMQYERPEASSTSYTVEARTYDGDGNPVNADSTPTLTATGSVTGSLSGNLSAATNPATGVYRWTYTVANTATMEQVRYDLSATISTATFTQSAFTQVTDLVSVTWTSTDASRLLAVFNKLPIRAYLAGATASTGELVPGDILNQMPSAGWVDGSFGDRILIGANANRSPQVTGAGHIAADMYATQNNVVGAASFQPNWFVAAGIAADAVTKIQLGLATSTAQTAAQSDIDEIQLRLPASLIDGRMNAYVGAAGPSTINALALAPDAVTELQNGLATADAQTAAQLDIDNIQSRLPAALIDGRMSAYAEGGSGGLTTAQDNKLTGLYQAVYPPIANNPPLVITPSTVGTVTGYAVCYGLTGVAQAGIQVQYRLQSGPQRDLGRIFRGSTNGVMTSAANGLVQFPGLVPGATYYFSCGNTEVSVTIPLTADPLHGYALPSFTAT
jgi:hypothetical protein